VAQFLRLLGTSSLTSMKLALAGSAVPMVPFSVTKTDSVDLLFRLKNLEFAILLPPLDGSDCLSPYFWSGGRNDPLSMWALGV